MFRRCLLSLSLILGCTLPATHAADPFAALLNKPAPEVQADFTVNGKATKLSDLKGKVVVLDVWAVFCGPCLEAVPNLKLLNDKYKDQGLALVGVTYYLQQLKFDKSAGRLSRAVPKLNVQQEQQMLKDFTAYHKMDYPTFVLTEEANEKLIQNYKIKDIPLIVVIDRKGVVRMVSNDNEPTKAALEKAFQAIDAKVKELLAEKE